MHACMLVSLGRAGCACREEAMRAAEARAWLLQRSLVEAEPEEAREAAAAKLAIFKLTAEEAAFKPVPLLPGLAELSPADLAEVPAARQSGPFNAFTPPAEGRPGQQWVVRCCGVPVLLRCRVPWCTWDAHSAGASCITRRTASHNILSNARRMLPSTLPAGRRMHGWVHASMPGWVHASMPRL